MSEPPVVPGFVVGRALGASCWLARELSAGGLCVVRVVPPEADLDRLEGVPSHPSLLVPRVRADVEGRQVLVAPRMAGAGLAGLLDRSATLPVGQVVTLLVGLGEALDALHAVGRAFGPFDASSVLLDRTGRPVLDGVQLVGHGSVAPTADDDLRALAQLALRCLGEGRDRAAERLRELLVGVVRDPAGVDGAGLGARAATIALPEPLRLGAAAAGARSREGRAARPARRSHAARRQAALRRVGVVAAVAGVLALAVLTGTWWAARARSASASALSEAASDPVISPSPSASASQSTSADVDWAAVLVELDAARAAAFAAVDPLLLGDVDVDDSPALRRDAATLDALGAAGLHAEGLSTVVVAVRAVGGAGEQVRLQVVDERSAYHLVDDKGRVVETRPAAGRAGWRVDLQRWPDAGVGWRIVDVQVDPTAVR